MLNYSFDVHQPLISVVVPVYNVELHLQQCISSILEQSYHNIELILIDDGSTDKSSSICDHFSQVDLRIKVHHKKNEGVSAARNLGINIATGEYICFIDSDDWVDPDYLASFFVNDNIHPNSLYIQGYREVYPDEKKWDFRGEKKYAETLQDIAVLFSESNILLSTGPVVKLFDLHLVNKNNIRFRTDMDFGEDTIFYFDYLYFIEKCYVIDAVGYNYRKFWSNNSLIMKKQSTEYYIKYMERLIISSNFILTKFGIPAGFNYFYHNISYALFLILKSVYTNNNTYSYRINFLKTNKSLPVKFKKKTKFLLFFSIISSFPVIMQDVFYKMFYKIK